MEPGIGQLAGRWESEGTGFRLATYRKAQRVGCCITWADDLFAMAGTMNHLTRILEDITNAIERLAMRGKRKVLPLLLGHARSTNLEMLL